MIANGIDMYHGDDREDAGLSDQQLTDKFARMRDSGIFWVMHKVTQGINIVDARYKRRRDCARRAGIEFFGGYHFLTNAATEDELANFVKNADDDGVAAYAVDFERSPHAPSVLQLYQFCVELDAEMSIHCKVYGGGYLRSAVKPVTGGFQAQNMEYIPDYLARKSLWLAEYGPHQNIPWPWSDADMGMRKGKSSGVWAWQFTERGNIPEIVGNTDLNYFAGKETDMRLQWRT